MLHQRVARHSESPFAAPLTARTTWSNSLWRSTTACLQHKVGSCRMPGSPEQQACGLIGLVTTWVETAPECLSARRRWHPHQIFTYKGEVGLAEVAAIQCAWSARAMMKLIARF
jgi:hypothetical protein